MTAFPLKTIPVTGVTLAPNTDQTIEVDQIVTFIASVAPDNATDRKVKWSVSGTDIVTLYEDKDCQTEVTLDTRHRLRRHGDRHRRQVWCRHRRRH